jgi:hypothetical protein
MDARPLPIGMAYVAGHLDQTRHTVKALDLMFSDDYLAEVERVVTEYQPQVVGISLRNLGNHSYLDPHWALPITKEVIDKVRSLSSATIVCGGPAFSLLPRECFAYLEPDLGVAGDAGETFAELANRLEVGEPSYYDLPGLVRREGGEIVFHDARCYSEFTKPPRLEELDMAKYRQAGFGIGILTKLGDFSYPTGEAAETSSERAWRVIRPIDEVVHEVKDMEERFGLRKVFFIDNGFNVPLDHAKSLCRALAEADLKLHWNTCLAPFGCDEELVGLMKGAGCALVIMGRPRGDGHGGAVIGESLDRWRDTCRLCEDGELHYTISQNFGEPGETRETVEEKLNFLRSIKPAMANLRVGVPIQPGSDLAATALAEGVIADEGDLIRPTFYMAEPVKDWIVDYLKAQAAQNPRWNLV